MITSFEVGAVFKIINQASPTLLKILGQIRELNQAIDKARINMNALGQLKMPTGMRAAIGETESLAAAWSNVAKNAALARRQMGSAASAGRGTGGGGGNRFRPRSGGGSHISGPGFSLPGGGHARLGGAGMAAAGIGAYGVYEAAEIEDVVWQMLYHSKQDQKDPRSQQRMRGVVQRAMVASGYNVHDVGEAALQEIRMFQGTPGGGIDILPDMMEVAAKEARAKGSTLAESMKSFIGLAHMTQTYDPAAIKKLAPAFAYMSTANPASLSSIERAAGYALPLMQSGLEIDPMDSLLLGTALTRAGATNSKSGTWLREMAIRAMPGTSMMSKMAYKKHEEALEAFGLSSGGQPTWFGADGKPDIFKMLEIGASHAAGIPISKRAAYERALFGAQGSGAFALLSNPAVAEQIGNMRRERDSPEFRNQYSSFLPDYAGGSTVQNTRTGMQEFNVTMQDLGRVALPAVNHALNDFKAILEGIRNILPGGDGKGGAVVGGHALVGAVGGALAGMAIGAFGGPIGMAGGALIGGVAGGVEGVAETYMRNMKTGQAATGNSVAQTVDAVHSLAAAIRGAQAGPGGVFAGGTSKAPQISLSLNVDGRALAQAVSASLATLSEHPTGAPAADGMGTFFSGDHNQPDN